MSYRPRINKKLLLFLIVVITSFVVEAKEDSLHQRFNQYRDTARYDNQFQVGSQILEQNPDDLTVLLDLSSTAEWLVLTGNNKYLQSGFNNATHIVELIEGGKELSDNQLEWNHQKKLYLSQAFEFIGIYYSHKNKADKAIEALNKSIDADENNIFAYYFLGLSYGALFKSQMRLIEKKGVEKQEVILLADKAISAFNNTIKCLFQLESSKKNFKLMLENCREHMTPIYEFRNGGLSKNLSEDINKLIEGKFQPKSGEEIIRGKAIKRITPDYPTEAKAIRMQSNVVVKVVISEEGKVIAARCVFGAPPFQSNSLYAVKKWKFEPTLVNSKPVKVNGFLTFAYRL